MKILFLMLECPDLNTNSRNMYADLALEFKDEGHDVTVMALSTTSQTNIFEEGGLNIVRVDSMNSQATSNFLKKGIAYALMPYSYKQAYKRYLKNDSFDLILMPTPPITLVDFVSYIKKKTQAKYYLILRDIHPHSFYGTGAIKNPFIFLFFNNKAQKAYKIADYIGCMSPRNIDFVKTITSNLDPNKLKILPNWVKDKNFEIPDFDIKEKYGLKDKYVAIYGGNLSIGQDVDNIISLAKHYLNNKEIAFLVVGKGMRKQYLMDQANENQLTNMIFLDHMPRYEYENLLATADIGLISLTERYTVPTCPSKVISYMSQKIPVLAMINKNNDYGQFYIDKSGCGLWSEGYDKKRTFANFEKLYKNIELRKQMSENGYTYYKKYLTSSHICKLILKQIND